MKTVFGNLSIRAIVFAMIVMGPICAYAQTSGTTVSLDGNTGKLLLSEGAGSGTYSAFWKHEQAPIQLVMTNCADGTVKDFNGTSNVFHGINAETGLFTTLPNNMTIVDEKLAIYNWVGNYTCSYFAIIAPKGYRILRYIIDADVSENNDDGEVDFREFHLSEGAKVIDDGAYAFQTTATGSSTVIDRVLDYSSPRLYFKITFPGTTESTTQYSFKFKTFKVVYAIDKSFETSLPNTIDGVATNKFGSGIINLGEFAAQTSGNKLWTFTSSNVNALSEVEVYDLSENKDLDFAQVNGSPYYFTASNGDYMLEAPKQFRIIGAKVNFLNVITSEPTVETGSINVTTGTGTLTSYGTSSYKYLWTGTDKAFTITETNSKNNINSTNTDGDLNFHSGGSASSTYAIAAPAGYVITGYSFDASRTDNSKTVTISAGSKSLTITNKVQSFSVSDLEDSSTSFTVAGNNVPVLFDNFTISYKSASSGSSESTTPTTTVTCVETTSRAATLFDNPESTSSSTNHYRIPAITLTADGNLLAISDLRIGASADVGSNAISLVARKSADNGDSWGTESTIIAGNGSGFDYAHGDAAVVTDSETGKIILLAASGTTGYGSNGVQLGQYYSTDNGATWTGSEITSTIKSAFTSAGLSVSKQFFTSGRIIQSKKVKVGTSYRIYSAMCTGNGSIVMYSDDFGGSWAVLGSKVAYSGGDETVLEELPNGDLLLSARLSGMGRGFAVYNYSDLTTGTGSWNSTTTTGISTAANCNGEMLLVPTKYNNVYVLLHSVALSGRNNVTIYYKVIDATTSDYTSPSFYSSGWNVFKQVSTTSSAYSTMVLDKDGDVAFLYEENNYSVSGAASYDIIFKSFKVNVAISGTGTEPYTAGLYDKRGETIEVSKSVEYNTLETLTLDDLNNDAFKFNISGLAEGQKALFNVELDLLPLDPHIQTVNVSVNANGKVYNRVVNSLNYEFSDDGEPLAISISDEDYVADNCFLFFQDAFNENENSTNIGNGKSNFFLMGSDFDLYTRASESVLSEYKSPLPSMGDANYPSEASTWDSSYFMGAKELPFTNIGEFTNTSGPTELQETAFNTLLADAELNCTSAGVLETKKFTEAASNTLNVYIYSCDIPVYNLTKNAHVAYRFYDVKAKLEVVYEEPVVEVTPIYNSTLKGKNNKKATITADKAVDSGHKFVGIKVTSKVKDGQTGTALGHLNSTEIINAIKTAITDYAYSSEDLLRGILYVDMSALKSVTTRDAETDPWDAFHQGTADNCLYFMPSGFNRNVENTIKGGENGEALGNIIIKDKQPFYTPYKFKTGTYYAIYNREITGGTSTKAVTQSTLVLPFDVTLNEGKAVDAKNEEATEPEYITYYSLGALGEKASENGKVWGVTATPLDATVAKANTPYHISTENPLQACSFAIKQVNANFVASTSNTDGSVYEYDDGSESNWKAYGSYCGEAVKTTEAKTGETFYYSKDLYWRSSTLTTTDKFYILPFRAYFESIEAVQDGVKTFSVFLEDYNDATDIESVETGNTVVSSDAYTLQGIKVNTQGLKRGIYIVGGKKIYVK